MTYYRKTDNAKAQIVEHSPVTDTVYVQFDDEPPDHHALFACSDCHDAIDGRARGVYWDYKDILRGHLRTMDIWVKQGLIKI